MKRFTLFLLAATTVLLGTVGAAAPAAIAADAPTSSTQVGSIRAIYGTDVDDFSFSSFAAQYSLDTDEDGHSLLTTTETLVADFPPNQNHGIKRLLVDKYDGHPTDIEIVSVTDGAAEDREYETDSDGDFLELTIADEDYVSGPTTYEITYTQRNVTRYAADTNADEFYWDTNGTGWAQDFAKVSAEITLTDALASRLTGLADAATGSENEDGPATIERTETGFATSATDLGPGENLSFAIGFEPGTFVPRPSGFFDSVLPSISLAGFILALVGLIVAVIVRVTRLRDAPGRGTIIAQYTPPKGVGIPLSAVLLGRTPKVTPAQILALAIAGNIRIIEDTRGSKQNYRLEFLTTDGADADGTEFLHALFGRELTPGEDRSLTKTDTKAATRITKIIKHATEAATSEGYRRTLPWGAILGAGLLAAIGAVVAIIFAIGSLDQDFGGLVPLVFLIGGFLVAVAAILVLSKIPLTTKGTELREYLDGLKLYITVAEEQRLRYLQSPEGAERTAIATDDRAEVIKINEKLLPYAVLFGNERQWAGELGRYYEETGQQPDWYYGNTAFNAALFASTMSSVATSAASSFNASTGGSGGGAVSGGGGGGGGGGGV